MLLPVYLSCPHQSIFLHTSSDPAGSVATGVLACLSRQCFFTRSSSQSTLASATVSKNAIVSQQACSLLCFYPFTVSCPIRDLSLSSLPYLVGPHYISSSCLSLPSMLFHPIILAVNARFIHRFASAPIKRRLSPHRLRLKAIVCCAVPRSPCAHTQHELSSDSEPRIQVSIGVRSASPCSYLSSVSPRVSAGISPFSLRLTFTSTNDGPSNFTGCSPCLAVCFSDYRFSLLVYLVFPFSLHLFSSALDPKRPGSWLQPPW